MIDVKIQNADLKALERRLRSFPGEAPRVLSTAMNRTAKSVRSDVAKAASKDVKLTQKAIKERINQRPKASRARLYTVLRISPSRFPLMAFKPRQTKKGLSYRISRSGGIRRAAGTFKTDLGRYGESARRRIGEERVPTQTLFGPSVAAIVSGPIERGAEADIRRTLDRHIESRIKYLIERRGRR